MLRSRMMSLMRRIVYACSYAFNSTDVQAIASGFDGAVAMSGQTGVLTYQGGLSSSETRISSNGALQAIDFSSGKKVYEVLFSSSAAALTTTGAAGIAVIIADTGSFTTRAGVSLQITSSGLEIVVIGDSSSARYVAAAGGLTTTVGLELDSASGTFRAIVDGVAVTLSSDTYTGMSCFLAIQTEEVAGGNVADAGLVLSAEVRTAAADITQSYGVGSSTICDNAL